MRHHDGFWPLNPGLFDAPIRIILQLQRWADAWDEAAIAQFGFGIGDLIEVALRLITAERRRLATGWQASERATAPCEPPRVNPAEVAGAQKLLAEWSRRVGPHELPEPLVTVVHPTGDERQDELDERHLRLNRALEFATLDVEDVYPEPSRGNCLVGALAVRSGDRLVPVPGSLALEGLGGSITRLLADLAASAGARRTAGREALAEQLAEVSWRTVRNSFENLVAHCVPVTLDPNGATYWMVCPSARHVVVIALATGVAAGDVDKAVERARRELNRFTPGATLRAAGIPPTGVPIPDAGRLPVDPSVLAGGSGRVAADAEVTRVVLTDGPRRAKAIERWHRGPVQMPVDNWCLLAADADDPEVLWSFLDELSLLPGLNHITAFDVCDVWAVFRKYGALNPGAFKHPDWLVPARESGSEWQRGATLDPVEELLARWNMGATHTWPSCTIDSAGQVELRSLTYFAQAVVNPTHGFGVVVCDAERRTDHYFAGLLADAVQFTLLAMAGRPADEGWAAWRAAAVGEPLVIELMEEPLDQQSFPISLYALTPGTRVELCYDERRLRHLPAQELHGWLGHALADAVLGLTGHQSIEWGDGSIVDSRDIARDDPRAASARKLFLDAWLATTPPLRSFRYAGPSARPATVFVAARTSTQAHIRAGRQIANELVRRGVSPQRLTGHAAIPLLGEICAAADAALARLLTRYGPGSVRAAAEEVERTWEARFQSEQRRAVGTDLTSIESAEQEVVASETTRAADHVLELLIRLKPTGRRRIDQRDWTQLVNLAAECLRLRDHFAAAGCGLLTLDLEVTEDGLVRSQFASALVDLPRHQAERMESHAASVASMIEDSPLVQESTDGAENPFVSLHEHFVKLASGSRDQRTRKRAELILNVDDAMRREMGTDMDALNAVLVTLGAWNIPGDPHALTAVVAIDELAGSAADWSGVERGLIEGALGWLTLTDALLEGEELPHWATEGRNARLTVRPLIKTDDPHRLLLLPRRATAVRRILSNYFVASRLPWPASALPQSVNAALHAWGQHEDRQFEIDVEDEFVRCGIIHRRRSISPHKAAKKGVQIRRELDLLAADPARSTIWVVEAKNQNVPYGPNQMLHEYVDYHGIADELAESISARQAQPPDKAFIGKLLDNVAEIAGQKEAVLRMLGIQTDDFAAWCVMPLIVTSRPTPAAAVADPQVKFATTSGLRAILDLTHPAAS